MPAAYTTGLETLLREHRTWLQGARIGLVAHPASRDHRGRGTAERLRREPGLHLAALFGAEHGFFGLGGAGQHLRGRRHPAWGIPIYSLYGRHRNPTAHMLRGVDVLLFDLQDIAVRCYTYASTLRLLLEAAAAEGKTVIIADRPVPLPNTLDGPLLDPALESFVGYLPAPLHYGMTPGETACWLCDRLHVHVDLRVARMRGYTRDAAARWWKKWVPPSPALRSFTSAVAYTTTVCTEALPALDCARTTPYAFQVLRATWLRGNELAEAMNEHDLPGVRFRPHRSGRLQGVRLVITDPSAYRPVTTGVALLATVRDHYGHRSLWGADGTRPDFFDKLMGTAQVGRLLRRGASGETIAESWTTAHRLFAEERAPHLLYEERVGPRTAAPRPTPRPARGLPTRAVVLAAGLGTRMLPLTRDLPKALIPLWGKPMLRHALELLAAWGVRDVLINLHHLPTRVLHDLRTFRVPGLRIALSLEPTILGTGGALPRAAWFLDDQPFWLLNADVAADLDPRPLVEAFDPRRHIAALWLHADKGPRTVEMAEGRITSFTSRRPGRPGTYTFCGLHLLAPRILDFLPPRGVASIIDAYQRALRAGWEVSGVSLPDVFWADIGRPELLLEAHRATRRAFRSGKPGGRLYDPAHARAAAGHERAGARVQGVFAAGPDVEVAPGADLEDVVLLRGARVGSRARLCRSVVGEDTAVTGRGGEVVLRASAALDQAEAAAWRASRGSLARAHVSLLGVRGSGRSFLRVQEPGRRAILVRYSRERKENALYAGHAEFLRRQGLPVPRVILHAPRDNLLLLEDLGDRSLAERAARHPEQKLVLLYRAVLHSVARLHREATREAQRSRLRLMPPFTPRLYRWEHELFAEHFLRGRLGYAPRAVRAVLDELGTLYRPLQSAPRVLVHRDLQSSNILWKGGRHYLIDFQGMRYGPAAYDLASLLCDPYVSLSLAQQEALRSRYARIAGARGVGRELFWTAAVQRLVQALGAFGRLARRPGGASFERHIAPACRMLLRALSEGQMRPLLRAACEDAMSQLACSKHVTN